MSVGERVKRRSELSDMTKCFTLGGIKARYPSANEKELKIGYAAIVYGREFAIRNFQWDPEVEGY